MPSIATIGFFDGVHRGHRFLLSQLLAEAERLGEQPLIFTFVQHPREVLQGECPPLLTTTDEREQMLELFAETHFLDFAQIQPFTAAEFTHYLATHWKVKHLLLGYNHRFGSDRQSIQSAADASKSAEPEVEYIRADAYMQNGEKPSSTRIREHLLYGRVREANELLGYRYSLTGRVVPGRQIGRTIGFPTANIEPPAGKLVPMAGVYEARILPLDRPALVNIGTNPTVNAEPSAANAHLTIEAYIPGFEGDLYDRSLTLQFRRHIRQEKRFESLDELKAQITNDLKTLQI